MGRTVKLRKYIETFLRENGKQNTNEILDHLNANYSWGTTSQQLGNVLSKNKKFRKVGTDRTKGILGSNYTLVVWDLAEQDADPE